MGDTSKAHPCESEISEIAYNSEDEYRVISDAW